MEVIESATDVGDQVIPPGCDNAIPLVLTGA
jgi:hypothetical protein